MTPAPVTTTKLRAGACALLVFALSAASARAGILNDKILRLKIPERIGRVDASFPGQEDSLWILIDSPGDNPVGRKNLLTLLDILFTLDLGGRMNLLAVEGASGFLARSPLWALQDAKLREAVVLAQIEGFGLSLGQAAQLLSRPSRRVFGIENEADGARRMLQLLQIYQTDPMDLLTHMERALSAFKKSVFPEAVQSLYALRARLDSGDLTLPGYCAQLLELARKAGVAVQADERVAELARLDEELRAVDPDALATQRRQLLSDLKQRVAPEDLRNLAKLNRFYHVQKITELEYATLLRNFAQTAKLDLAPYPVFQAHAALLARLADVDTAARAPLCDEIEAQVREALLRNTDERLLDGIIQGQATLRRLLLLQPGPRDARDIQNQAGCLSPAVFAKFFARYEPATPEPDRPFLRDTARMDALFSAARVCALWTGQAAAPAQEEFRSLSGQMKTGETDTVVVLAGAPRNRALARILRSQHLSHLVIAPRCEGPCGGPPRLVRSLYAPFPLRVDSPHVAPVDADGPPAPGWEASASGNAARIWTSDPVQAVLTAENPGEALRVLLASCGLLQCVRQLGSAWLGVCADTDTLRKALNALRSDIAAGRIDTVEQADALWRDGLAEISRRLKALSPDGQTGNPWLDQLAAAAPEAPVAVRTARTVASGRNLYLIFRVSFFGQSLDWALNLNGRISDPPGSLWSDPSVLPAAEPPGPAAEEPPAPGEPAPESGEKAAAPETRDTAALIATLLADFAAGVRIDGDRSVTVPAAQTRAVDVLRSVLEQVIRWKDGPAPQAASAELAGDIEFDILNRYSIDVTSLPEVETLLFNLPAVVDAVSKLIDTHRAAPQPSAPEPAASAPAAPAAVTPAPAAAPDAKAAPAAPEPPRVRPADFLALMQGLWLPPRAGDGMGWMSRDLALVGGTLDQARIVSGDEVRDKARKIRLTFEDVGGPVLELLRHPPADAKPVPRFWKLDARQVEELLSDCRQANPVAFSQALAAGHVDLIRAALLEMEIRPEETLIDALQRSPSDGARILLRLMGRRSARPAPAGPAGEQGQG